MYILIIAIILLIVLSSIKVNIYNIEETNYIMVKFLIFTLYLRNNRLIDIIKSFSTSDLKLREQINKYRKLNPIAKKIINKLVISNASINKYVNKYDQTYQIITLYILSSYFKSYISSNTKLLKEYSYELKYSEYRDDTDFRFDLKISVIDLILSVISGMASVFKNKKRSIVNGS